MNAFRMGTAEEDLAVLSKPDSQRGDLEQMRRLQRGGTLPDGSYLSWIEGEFYLDGISVKIPYLGLSKILKENRGIEGINWKSLLLSISVAVTRYNEQSYGILRKIRCDPPGSPSPFRA